MGKKIISVFSVIILLLSPAFIAQGVQIPPIPTGNLDDFTGVVNSILSLMWKIFLTIFFILLFVSAFTFLTAQGDENKINTARQSLVWAVVSFVVATLSFSIPETLSSLLGLEGA